MHAAPIAPAANNGSGELNSLPNASPSKSTKTKKGSVDMNSSKSFKNEMFESDFGQEPAYQEDDFEEEADKDMIEIYRVNLKKFLATHALGRFYENLLLFLSSLSCLEFIFQTYLDKVEDAELIEVLDRVEQGLAVLFSVDWMLHYFLAEHKMLYISSFYSMIDILTVIPIWVSSYSYAPRYDKIQNFRDVIVYILVGMATTRILRALRIRKKLVVLEDEVERVLGEMALSLIVMVLFYSALLQYFEKELLDLPFHTWMYFMVVTITTVGFGDISPESEVGRFATMVMICIAIVMVPQMTNELLETVKRQSIYARNSFQPKGKASTHSHVVICGEMNALAIKEFFEELFHEDHENLNLHAVVLCEEAPNSEMDMLLRDPMYSMNITYLEGTALSEVDLKRAYSFAAVSIFIMTNKFSNDPDEEDAKTILQQFSIKQYVARTITHEKQPRPLLCIQLIRPENRRHLVQPANRDDDLVQEDLVMCLNEIKMGVIAKAVMFQGTNTLLMNLLTSFADDDDGGNFTGSHEEIDSLEDDDNDHWMGEYQRGCDWEIYTTELSEKFEGALFVKLSEMLYQRFGIVLFGLQIEDLQRDRSNTRVIMNPANFIIPSKKEFKIDAFVIAKNANQSDLSFSADEHRDDDENITKHTSSNSHTDKKTHAPSTTNINAKQDENKEERQHGSPINFGSTYGDHVNRSIDNNDTDSNGDVAKKPWQALMRKMDTSVKRKGSDQEFEQKMEDQYLLENFFTLDKRAKQSDCIIHSSLDEEYPLIQNHTIIVGKSLSTLYDLIKNLRAKYLETLRHVVILTPLEIPYAVWSRISIFKCVLVIRGSPLEESDVLRAGIFKAAQVIVLANKIDAGIDHKAKAGATALIDADAVFTYQCVRRMNENISCVVEIVKSENVKYLDPEAVVMTSTNIEYKFTPQFASGALFTSSLLDTLVCQAFYNTKIIKVIAELFSGVERKSRAELLANIKGDKKHDRRGISAIVSSTLYQISIPDLPNRTYGYLFKHLAHQGIIPLGIYRGVFPHMKVGPKQNKYCYCYTNPAKDTELFSCDKVYVLSPTPLISPNKKNIKMAENAMIKRSNLEINNEDIHHGVNRVQEVFSRKLEQFEASVDHKLDMLVTMAGGGGF